MTIAIDFDNTWTADCVLFRLFHVMTQAERSSTPVHTVIIATSRHPDNSPITEEERERYCLPHTISIVYCHGTYKQTACERAGYKVDIWIDDTPGMIQPCKVLEDDL